MQYETGRFDSVPVSYEGWGRSTHHPEESFIGEIGVLFNCGENAEDEAHQHQHKPAPRHDEILLEIGEACSTYGSNDKWIHTNTRKIWWEESV